MFFFFVEKTKGLKNKWSRPVRKLDLGVPLVDLYYGVPPSPQSESSSRALGLGNGNADALDVCISAYKAERLKPVP